MRWGTLSAKKYQFLSQKPNLVRRIAEERKFSMDDLTARNERGITGYLLMARGEDWDQGLSDEELIQVMDRTTKWFDALLKSGKVKGGAALLREGVVVSKKGAREITDGPFAEAKEAIGGYLYLDVATLEEAAEI